MLLSQMKNIHSKLKISTKLIIPSAVFFIPISMLFSIMLFMHCGTIQKSTNQLNGITSLKPAVVVLQYLPEHLSMYLGLKSGDLRAADENISAALLKLDREMKQYQAVYNPMPDLLPEWDILKRMDKNDREIFERYLKFAYALRDRINWIAERSQLVLPTDMSTCHHTTLSITIFPEVTMRLMNTRNLLRTVLHNAESEVVRWNRELVEAQSQGRRLGMRPYDGDPRAITVNMLIFADAQTVRNCWQSAESEKDRVNRKLNAGLDENPGMVNRFDELRRRLDRYLHTADVMTEQSERMQRVSENPFTVAECLESLSQLNTDICQLWLEILNNLEMIVQRKSSVARWQLVLHLFVVLASIGAAIGFTVITAVDIRGSVSVLKTMLRGLHENDLTLSLKINSKDEFGELMAAFNDFLSMLRSTFGSFKQNTQLVSKSVFDLSSSSKEIFTTANEQSSSVSEIVSTMENSKSLSEQMALKTTDVAHLATETQELSSKGAELREANQTMMEDIRKQNQKIISEISNLSNMIIGISEAVRIIDSIADQTKLIAFNASLEASSSGEAGARFSVVASEIRRFADNVAESTREIKQKIEEVQNASKTLISEANNGSKQIEIGYERMSEQKTVFENIVDKSQNVAIRSQQISNLSKQQELASSQIFIALKEISAGVNQFVIATSSTSKIADSLNCMSNELREKVEKYRTET
jgi:methyl-accepting chemotaxis protein